MCFSAYYVTYESHFLTEQLVVFVASTTFLPRDVLIFSMYYALIDTFVQHSGVDFDHLRLPLLPFATVGHVRRILSLHGAPFGAYNTAHHDWHHERCSKNYALYFTYLDKLCGSYYGGRKPQPSGMIVAKTLCTTPRSSDAFADVAPVPVAGPVVPMRSRSMGG